MGSAENEVRYTMFAEHILLGEMLFMGFMMFGLPSPTGGTHTDVLGFFFFSFISFVDKQTHSWDLRLCVPMLYAHEC